MKIIMKWKGVTFYGKDYPCSCGSELIRCVCDTNEIYHIECRDCGNTGPEETSMLSALAKWETENDNAPKLFSKTEFEKRVSDGEDPHMILLEMILDIEARLG